MKRTAVVPLLVALLALVVSAQRYTAPGKVVNSRHDLSVNSTGAIYKAALPNVLPQNQPCVFCHTPHNANPKAPLWNHSVTGSTYTLYSSSTVSAAMAQPASASPYDNTRLCLSCHDGTVALGNTVNNGNIAMANSVTTLPATAGNTYSPPRSTNLGTNLADDHPVAFAPTSPVLPAYPQVQAPPPGDPVQLESGKLQCTSCHNPHEEAVDPTERRFLRKSNSAAAICTTCHKLQGSVSGGVNGWNWISGPSSDHQSHTNSYTASTNDPGDSDSASLGSHTNYTTTTTNGCEACHRPHTAHNAPRLLKGATAQVCFQCHDGNATTSIKNPPANTVVQNIKAAFTGKTYKHPGSTVAGSSGATDAGHDPAESPTYATTRHAACDDCHNPHASRGYESAGGGFPVPPAMPSSLWGVSGATKTQSVGRNPRAGTGDALYQYEICFKCHADSTTKPQTTDASTAGIGYGRLAMRNSDFTGATNCTTPLTTRGNTRSEFTDHTTYPSYHPVVDPLNHTSTYLSSATAVPSLRPFVKDRNGVDITSRPLNAGSIVYCTDCHNNDTGRDTVSTRTGTTSPAGPHGSANAHILERTNAVDTPGTPCSGSGGSTSFSVSNYALCDKCHDITNSIRANQSFSRHSLHTGFTGCMTCHDPHAAPGTGASPALVNFDKAIVGPNNGVLQITNTSLHHGTCTLRCHGTSHSAYSF